MMSSDLCRHHKFWSVGPTRGFTPVVLVRTKLKSQRVEKQ